MNEQTTQTEINIETQSLDFSSYRVPNSNCLSDYITLPLSQALAVIEQMWINPGCPGSLLGVLENEIKDAKQVAVRCQCRVEQGSAS